MWPVDSEGRFNERGNEYEFGNEVAGIFGMRRVEVKPLKSFNYKITDYKKGIRDSRNLFTSATLKGGPITPKKIVDAYINANRALYKVNRELYQDIEAAQVLGVARDSLDNNMDKRGEGKAFDSLIIGEFRPLNISRDVQEIFEIQAAKLGMADPFAAAESVIDSIRELLSTVSLTADLFPNIENPLSALNLPPLPDFTTQLPDVSTLVQGAPGFTGQNNVSLPNNMGLVYNENDPLAKKIDTIAKVDSLI
jgi:hypothetical protein